MLNIEHILEVGGILAVAAIVFAESGLLIGFFLPGDTLLFTAGVFSSQGSFNIILLLVAIVASAIIGDNVGYSIGRRLGHRLFTKKDGIFFRHEYIKRSEKFFKAHGGKTITLARFVPVIRTFAPMIAGAGKMPRRQFMIYNILGGSIWGLSITLLGYYLGSKVSNIEKYIVPAFFLATAFTFGPPIIHILKDPKTRSGIIEWLKNQLSKITLNKKV